MPDTQASATTTPADAPINLFGDRHIEWSWVAAHLPQGPGQILEFGCGESWVSMVAVHRGLDVTAVDLTAVTWSYIEPRARFIQGDLLTLNLPREHFDAVINCSTIEHVGLAGRYGVAQERSDGDLEAMRHLRELMKPGALMLLTIPLGQDEVFAPMTRIYGQQRLPRLLEGYDVLKQAFWVKEGPDNRWQRTERTTALAFKAQAGHSDWRQCIYALGCYVLRKP